MDTKAVYQIIILSLGMLATEAVSPPALWSTFHRIDLNSDGRVNLTEFVESARGAYLHGIPVKHFRLPWIEDMGLSPLERNYTLFLFFNSDDSGWFTERELIRGFLYFDINEDNLVTFEDEFVERVREVKETTSQWSKIIPRLESSFHSNDVDADGFLNITELVDMFEAADLSGDGQIDQEEMEIFWMKIDKSSLSTCNAEFLYRLFGGNNNDTFERSEYEQVAVFFDKAWDGKVTLDEYLETFLEIAARQESLTADGEFKQCSSWVVPSSSNNLYFYLSFYTLIPLFLLTNMV